MGSPRGVRWVPGGCAVSKCVQGSQVGSPGGVRWVPRGLCNEHGTERGESKSDYGPKLVKASSELHTSAQ